MAKRNIPVNVILHTPEDGREIRGFWEMEEFWIDKMIRKIQKCPVSEEQKYSFLRSFMDKALTGQEKIDRKKRGMEIMLQTERLILRRWEESDAESLYEYAKDPDVGPIAGWPSHQSVDESRDVIRNVFGGAQAYAVCQKSDNRAIGAIELKLNGHTDLTDREDECELGYWIGKPFWGQGLIPEAAREMIRHAFEDCGMKKIWCGYYDGNIKSKRVQEKCGFCYQRTMEGVDVPLMHETRTCHVSCLTKEEWKNADRNLQ